MTNERMGAGRRYGPLRRHRKQERDPYLFTLVAQTAVCAAVLAACWLLRGGPAMSGARGWYLELLSAERVELPRSEAFAAFSGRWDGLREKAEEAVSRAVSDLLSRGGRAVEASAPTDSEPLDGMGGWFGTGDAAGKEAPASCALSPILVSAPVDPPVSGKVTCDYGWRVHPITGTDDFHNGVDIAAAEGSGVYASLPGRVSEVGSSAIYGNFVTLDHGNGLTTTYCHCESIVAPEGANLRRGELVARVGSTGISTGPHVHFELGRSGTYYDPAWVLDGMNGHGV